MKKIIFVLMSLLIGILLFVVAVEMIGFSFLLETIFSLSLIGIVAILGTFVGIVVVSALRWNAILKSCGLKYSFTSLLSAWVAGFAVSYITPVAYLGGEPVRAYILGGKCRQKEKVKWPQIVSSIAIDKMLDVGSNLVILLLAVGLLLTKFSIPNYLRSTIIGILFLVVVGALLFLNRKGLSFVFRKLELDKIRGFGSANGKLKETFQEVGNFFRNRNSYFYQAFFYSFLKQLFVLARTWVILFFLDIFIISIPSLFLTTVLVTGLFYVAHTIPVPAAVGALEISQVFAFELLGYGANVGGAFSIILRCFEISLALCGIVIFIHFGFRQFIGKLISYFQKVGNKFNNTSIKEE